MRAPQTYLGYSLYCILFPLFAYSQEILWEKSYGGRHAEYLFDVQPTVDYGFILAGSSLSKKTGNKSDVGSGDLDYWVWKMDEHGEPDWQKSLGGSGTDMLRSIKITHDGGFILAGTSDSPKSFHKKEDCRGGNDYWVIKLDAKGEELWQKTFGGKGQDDLLSVALTNDGGYILAGSSDSDVSTEINAKQDKKENSRGNMDYWIIKLDSDGNEEWQKTYGGQYVDLLRSIEVTKDGGFILGGYSNSGQSGEKEQMNFGVGGDYWILKLNDKGAIEWQQTIGGDQDDQLQVIHQTYDGGYIAAGNSSSGTSNSKSKTNGKGTDFWIVKLDNEGVIDWQETYDFGHMDVLTSLVENEDHSLLLGGYSLATGENNEEGAGDFIALKISEKGEWLWDRTVGSDGEDVLRKVVETRDGGYLMAGTSNPESIKPEKTRKKRMTDLNPIDKNKRSAMSEKAQQKLDGKVDQIGRKLNDNVTKEIQSATEEVNNTMAKNNKSNFKMDVNAPTGNLLNPATTGGGENMLEAAGKAMEDKGPKPGMKASREKKINYGNKDFWVVKLKDKNKTEKVKSKIEAIPNPVISYTNVIVGFDFDRGTARLYDISGRELQKFGIENRTVPINLSSYPEGIYIVNIETNKGDVSIKLIKG